MVTEKRDGPEKPRANPAPLNLASKPQYLLDIGLERVCPGQRGFPGPLPCDLGSAASEQLQDCRGVAPLEGPRCCSPSITGSLLIPVLLGLPSRSSGGWHSGCGPLGHQAAGWARSCGADTGCRGSSCRGPCRRGTLQVLLSPPPGAALQGPHTGRMSPGRSPLSPFQKPPSRPEASQGSWCRRGTDRPLTQGPAGLLEVCL